MHVRTIASAATCLMQLHHRLLLLSGSTGVQLPLLRQWDHVFSMHASA